jgi:hypothetical protein
MLNNGTLYAVLQQQQCEPHAAGDVDAVSLAALAAGTPHGTGAAAAAAATGEAQMLLMLRQQVRKQWVVSRLLQAQGKLQEADVAGKACLHALQELGQLQAAAAAAAGTAADGTASLEGSVGTLQHAGQDLQVAQPPQQQQQQQQQAGGITPQQAACASVLLPNCVLDCTIDAPAVLQKLDEMWLSMQLLSAEQQLQGMGERARQEQQLCALQQQWQQQQQQQQPQAGSESQELAAVLQHVGEVHCGVNSVLEMLGPRCLSNAGRCHLLYWWQSQQSVLCLCRSCGYDVGCELDKQARNTQSHRTGLLARR